MTSSWAFTIVNNQKITNEDRSLFYKEYFNNLDPVLEVSLLTYEVGGELGHLHCHGIFKCHQKYGKGFIVSKSKNKFCGTKIDKLNTPSDIQIWSDYCTKDQPKQNIQKESLPIVESEIIPDSDFRKRELDEVVKLLRTIPKDKINFGWGLDE